MDNYIKAFKIIHFEALEASAKLIARVTGTGSQGVKKGDIIYFLKNEDVPEKGIIYAEVVEKQKSDYRVKVLGGEEKIIPYQRVRMFVPSTARHDHSVSELANGERELTDRLTEALARIQGQL